MNQRKSVQGRKEENIEHNNLLHKYANAFCYVNTCVSFSFQI